MSEECVAECEEQRERVEGIAATMTKGEDLHSWTAYLLYNGPENLNPKVDGL